MQLRALMGNARWSGLAYCGLLIAAMTWLGCGKGGPGDPSSQGSDETKIEGDLVIVLKNLSRQRGGTLVLPDGALLNIPAGALPADTTISFSMMAGQTDADPDHYYEVQPSLALDAPATLTVPYAASAGEAATLLTVFSSSSANHLRDSGTELSDWDFADVMSRDTARHTVTIRTKHFTGFGILTWKDEAAYLVVDIPGRYLKPGDILITLSAEHPVGPESHTPNWFPGHVGVYVGPDRFRSGETVVGPDGRVITGPAAVPDIVESVKAGVRNGSLAEFRTGFRGDHIYLGPRRLAPPQTLTHEERHQIADFALAQRGKGYNLVADSSHFLGNLIGALTFDQLDPFRIGGFSCVGLAEASYYNIGKSPISAIDRHVFSETPRDMYHSTVPVQEITARVGETIEIPVYGVVVDPRSHVGQSDTVAGFYTKARRTSFHIATSEYSIDPPGGMPQGGTWTARDDGYLFRWTPGPNDYGRVVRLRFHMNQTSQAFRGGESSADEPTGFTPEVAVLLGNKPIDQELVIKVEPPDLVAVGDRMSCARTCGHTIRCWGSTADFQMGLGLHPRNTILVPEEIEWLSDASQLAGRHFTCALKVDGTVFCAGHNNWGQLGDGSTLNRPDPVQVSAVDPLGSSRYLEGVSKLSGNIYNGCALKGRRPFCWGGGSAIDASTVAHSRPMWIPLDDVVDIAPGDYDTCAVTGNGSVWCWGNGYSVPVTSHGVPGSTIPAGTPAPVYMDATATPPVLFSGAVQVTVAWGDGLGFACARRADKTVWCWGADPFLGGGTPPPPFQRWPTHVTVQVQGISDAIQISAKANHACALRETDGSVWCWGDNDFGQLGDGTNLHRRAPVRVMGLADVVEIATGTTHSCARKRDGSVWCWGSNYSGELGDGTLNQRLGPINALPACPR